MSPAESKTRTNPCPRNRQVLKGSVVEEDNESKIATSKLENCQRSNAHQRKITEQLRCIHVPPFCHILEPKGQQSRSLHANESRRANDRKVWPVAHLRKRTQICIQDVSIQRLSNKQTNNKHKRQTKKAGWAPQGAAPLFVCVI